ncbi:MAG: hypothetical protein JXL80_16900 [Planctomycetes bacterium]|nr:hypothetical protein [Planctomycetota bacterium]
MPRLVDMSGSDTTGGLTIEMSGAEEARRRLENLAAQQQIGDSPELSELKARGVDTLGVAREVLGDGIDWAQQMASDFAIGQAMEATEEASRLVQDKGLGAVRELDDLLKQQAGRARDDALKTAESELKKGASRVADAALKKLASIRPSRVVRRVDQATEHQGECKLCHEPIVPGDRVTVCPKCGLRYHLKCFTMNGCVSPLCRAAAQPTQAPPMARPAERRDVPITMAGGSPKPRRCTTCGAQVSRGSLVCPQCGRWLYSGRMKNDPRSGRRPRDAGAGCGTAVLMFVGVAAALLYWWMGA